METAAFASRFFERLFFGAHPSQLAQRRPEQVTDGPTPIIRRPMGRGEGRAWTAELGPGLGPAMPSVNSLSLSLSAETRKCITGPTGQCGGPRLIATRREFSEVRRKLAEHGAWHVPATLSTNQTGNVQ